MPAGPENMSPLVLVVEDEDPWRVAMGSCPVDAIGDDGGNS